MKVERRGEHVYVMERRDYGVVEVVCSDGPETPIVSAAGGMWNMRKAAILVFDVKARYGILDYKNRKQIKW